MIIEGRRQTRRMEREGGRVRKIRNFKKQKKTNDKKRKDEKGKESRM